jgi:hypothetical protein
MVAAIEHHGDTRRFIFGAYLDEPLALIDVDTSETVLVENYDHRSNNINIVAIRDSSGNVVGKIGTVTYLVAREKAVINGDRLAL